MKTLKTEENTFTPMFFTRAKTEALRRAYDKARADKLEQFTFEGHPFLVAYAKYLLEYLDLQLKPDTREVSECAFHRSTDNGR